MDIVDTFNHLIPTEHLDDALFLGSNLENEVCEDFSTNQNVLEDSLKNMLSDKDPMLGSASAQFSLPVLDSTDPNFQMPCSTVGLDDIMDEGVKETAHSTIDEDGLSSNRKLRDQMDGTTVKSPRKSPRLMTQEPVRSLRQSTLAKRSNASPSLTAKKSPVKSGSVQKGGVKQQDTEQAKCESVNIEEHSKEGEHNSNEESVEVLSPSSGASERVKSCEDSYELEADTKHEIPNQEKLEDTSHEVENLSHLPGTRSPTKEKESGAQVLLEREHHSVGEEFAACTSSETNTVQNNNVIKNDEGGASINQFASEISSKEQAEHKAEEELSKTKMDDESKGTGMTDENAGDIQETFAVQSGLVDEKLECSSDLQTSGDVAHETGLPEEHKQESFEDAGKAELKDDSSSMKADQTASKMVDVISAKSEASVLECNVEDVLAQIIHQENDTVKMREHEAVELQEDGCSSISPKCVKNVKTKHAKSKRNKTTAAQQKLSPLNQDLASKKQVMSHVHNQSTVSLKRRADEQGNRQHFHKPVKVRKKHADKEDKIQSCTFGATLKKKAHVLGKNIPWVQVPGQGQKLSAERIVDKSSSHHVGSKETSHLHPKQGHLPHQDQKLLQKHHLPKTDNFIKEEGGEKDSIGTPVDSLKEDEKEKLKLRKLEKSFQPRQRRSSKSISVDEPPLFIPDNISTVKRESSEHPYSNESKSPWVPSKQCGFCRKPHGNSYQIS